MTGLPASLKTSFVYAALRAFIDAAWAAPLKASSMAVLMILSVDTPNWSKTAFRARSSESATFAQQFLRNFQPTAEPPIISTNSIFAPSEAGLKIILSPK